MSSPRRHLTSFLTTFLALFSAASTAAPSVRLIGVSQADQSVLGLQADGETFLFPETVFSGDGRYLLFGSTAGNLVAGDTNGGYDTFLRDLSASTTRRISVTAAGGQVAASEGRHTISEDGRYIAFTSAAPGLVPEDTDALYDVFLLDTQLGTLQLVSVSSVAGTPGFANEASISGDGRYVAFTSIASDLVAGDTNGLHDVFVRDMVLGTTVRASVADTTGAQSNSFSLTPRISRDGTMVAFLSSATNLVVGDTNNRQDVFVRSLNGGTTVRASVGEAGQQANLAITDYAASPSTAFIAFVSDDPNLVTGDTNGVSDVFVRNVAGGTTVRVSVGAGEQANGRSFRPAISGNANGQAVAFLSEATNLVAGDTNAQTDAFVRRVSLNTTERVSVSELGTQLSQGSDAVAISIGGRHLAFRTASADVVADDRNAAADIFVRSLDAGTTARANLADSSGPFPASSSGESYRVAVSDGGRYAAFLSGAHNLLPADDNGYPDAFVRDTLTGALERTSLSSSGTEISSSADNLALSANGERVIFETAAADVVAGDVSGFEDVFVRDRNLATTQRVSLFGTIEPNANSEGLGASADGRFVTYVSRASNFPGGSGQSIDQVYLVDTQTGGTQLASLNEAGQAADADCRNAAVSDDGRYVVFESAATNLASGDTTSRNKILRRDLWLNQTVVVDVAATAPPANGDSESTTRSISGDGRYVAFQSSASNLVNEDLNDQTDIFVRDLSLGTTVIANRYPNGQQTLGGGEYATISADGRFVTFSTIDYLLSGGPPGPTQIVLRDLLTNNTQTLSVDSAGNRGNQDSRTASIARDGRNVGFQSHATNWNLDSGGQGIHEDAFVAQLVEPTTTQIVGVTPSPTVPGQATTITVDVSGSDTEPRGAGLRVAAHTGEFCVTGVPVRISPTTARASCVLTLNVATPRTLTASWPGTSNYQASASAGVLLQVLNSQMFKNGFEEP